MHNRAVVKGVTGSTSSSPKIMTNFLDQSIQSVFSLSPFIDKKSLNSAKIVIVRSQMLGFMV